MKAKIALLLVLAIIVNSCNKSQFGTRPTLSLVSVSTTRLENTGDQLFFTFNFTDKQGEVDTLFMKRSSLVCSDTANTGFMLANIYDTLIIPNYTPTSYQKGQITVSCVYSGSGDFINLNSCLNAVGAAKTDTSYFLFCLKDHNGNLSDTVKSPKITIVKN